MGVVKGLVVCVYGRFSSDSFGHAFGTQVSGIGCESTLRSAG